LMRNFGDQQWAFVLTVLILTTSQIQCGWSQHDYGHLSVFKSKKIK